PKAEVRELARRFGLSVADKEDSQDICFVPAGRYTDVIERLLPGSAVPRDIVDLAGRVVRRHRRIRAFTVRPRRRPRRAAGGPARAAAWAWGRASRSTWCGSTPSGRAWSSDRATRCAPCACGCAT